MPETLQLLPFQTQYNCPVKLVWGGGEGRWGLCAMELVSVLIDQYEDKHNSMMSPQSVHPSIRALFQNVNDIDGPSDEERADALWPLLPAAFGTAQYENLLPEDMNYIGVTRFPTEQLAKALGVQHFVMPSSVVGVYTNGWKDFDKGVEALKIALTLYWSEVQKVNPGALPQIDFTEEQISNLDNWLSKLKNGELFAVANEYDSSLVLR